MPTFGTMGGMVQYTSDQVAVLGGEANFVPASWSTAVVEGKVDAIPGSADVRAIAYRTDVLEKIGVKPEDAFKDIASFEATLQKIKDAKIMNGSGVEIAPFINTGRNDWNVWQNASMWMWNYGGDILTADGKKGFNLRLPSRAWLNTTVFTARVSPQPIHWNPTLPRPMAALAPKLQHFPI